MKLVVATENKDKLKEIEGYLSCLPVTLIPQSAFNVPKAREIGLSFVENAIIKARLAAKYSDLPSIADDSGLAVDALGGAPGIYSARYAGNDARAEDNIKKLLSAISTLSGEERRARFYCAIAFVRHYNDPIPVICQAQWEGRLLTKPVGTNGFGYDPIFFIPNLNCTAAELDAKHKNQISHRAKALHEFTEKLKVIYPQIVHAKQGKE
ncbi:MAG: RdgB/HAM1 family non-canonical purine NTP pyrophosphatase [Candidatus Berkiella sp.]